MIDGLCPRCCRAIFKSRANMLIFNKSALNQQLVLKWCGKFESG